MPQGDRSTVDVPRGATAPVAFFDGIGTAHSLPLIAGLDRAAAALGLRRQWTTAIRPPDAGDASCQWVPTRAFYGEFCENGTTARLAYRTACRHAIDRAAESGAAFYCDLAVEQLLVSQGAPLRVGLPSVWIVHQVPVPRDSRPAALRAKMLVANPGRWRRQARAVQQRAVLRRLARADGRFVVHSEAARDRLGRIVGNGLIHVAAWPIASAASPPELATDAPDDVTAVFPGECRPGKGLDVLMQALPEVKGVDAFDLPSVVTADARALVAEASDPRIRMGTSWATNEAYQEHLRAAALAVLPYRSAATSNAGISASLLDVLAVGLPAVITRPIAGGLPDGYGGAVVVEPDSPAALAAGIAKALANLGELRRRARVEGPAYVLARHTYERYLETIVEAGSR